MHYNVGLILAALYFRAFVASHKNDHKTEMNFDGVRWLGAWFIFLPGKLLFTKNHTETVPIKKG